MTYTKKLMAQGQWSLRLKEEAPEQLIDKIEYAGHIVITNERIDIEAMSDSEILTKAKYVGVVTKKPTSEVQRYGGFGLVWWLGSQGRGKIFRGASAISWTNEAFEDAIDDILAAPTPITKNDIETTAGTYTQDFDLKNQREVLEVLTTAFGAEYRVNNDFTLDAGASGYLYNSTPTAVMARKFAGRDPEHDGLLVRNLSVDGDIEDFTTTAIVAAEGTGETLITEEVSLADKLFLDPQGNDIDRSFVVNEPSTSSANASDRAQAYLDAYGTIRKAVKVDLDDFDIEGQFVLGDLIYIWDPKTQLTDTDNEWHYRGQMLNPIAIRVVGETEPIRAGNGVYYRDTAATPNYTDLSDHFEPETGTSKIEVSASSRNLVNGESATLDARISIDPDGNDTIGPDTPAHASTPWLSTTYLDVMGIRKSRIVPVWDTPLNTDATAVTDGSHYTVRYRQNGQTEYQYLSVDWGVNTCSLNELAPGVVYEISVAASDVNGNTSTYAADESVTAAQATGVPSQPSVPTVAGNALNIQVVHDLTKNAGGNLEDDIDHLVVYGHTSSGFTPSSANRLGEIGATASHINLGVPVVGTFPLEDTATRYVVVTAVDREGNESAKSPEATVTADLIDTQHITNAAITNALIDNLAVTDAKIVSLTADKLTAGEIDAAVIDVVNLKAEEIQTGTLGVITLTLSNSASSKIQSFDGTTLIIRGDGYFKAVSGDIGNLDIIDTLTIESGGAIYSSSATSRVELVYASLAGESDAIPSVLWRSGGTVGGKIQVEASTPDRFHIESDNGADMWVYSDDAFYLTASGVIYLGGTGTAYYNYIEINQANDDVGLFVGASSAVEVLRAQHNAGSQQVLITYGSAGNPGLGFIGNATTGIYRADTNRLAIATGGVGRYAVDTQGRFRTEAFTTGSALLAADGAGSLSAPPHSFAGDTDTGAYRYGVDEYGISAGGAEMARFKNTTIDEARILPAYSNTSSGDATVGVTSTGLLRRQTSARKYKKYIKDADWLADIVLRPVEYKTKVLSASVKEEGASRHLFGFIADEIAEQEVDAARFSPEGEVEDFHDRAVMAVLAAKVNRLEDTVRKQQEELDECRRIARTHAAA